MLPSRLLFASYACLAVGLCVLVGFSQGTSGISIGSPITATSIHIDVATAGVPALVGLAGAAAGALLLLLALLSAIARVSQASEVPERREKPFQE